MLDVSEIAGTTGGEATIRTDPMDGLPRTTERKARNAAKPKIEAPSAHPICGGHLGDDNHRAAALADTTERKANTNAKPKVGAPSARPVRVGHLGADNHPATALADTIGQIVEHHRLRQDMIRARQRLKLQAQAVLRRLLDGDKVAAGKRWAQVKRDPAAPERAWLGAMLAAMEPLEAQQAATERTLAKLVRTLPIHAWAATVSGLGDVSLAGIIGECGGHAPGDFRTPAALWKRMGLGVISGGRQRRVAGDAALEHGYSPTRRSLMWNVGECIIKAQVRAEKDADGTRTGSRAIGPYGALYLERKAYEAGRVETAAHAHNRAKRYTEKRLLRDLWRAWRANEALTPILRSPAEDSPTDVQTFTNRSAPGNPAREEEVA
jgi:hypothetical protein